MSDSVENSTAPTQRYGETMERCPEPNTFVILVFNENGRQEHNPIVNIYNPYSWTRVAQLKHNAVSGTDFVDLSLGPAIV